METAYASVLATADIGLVACTPLLRRINIDTFARDIAAQCAQRSAVALGWVPHDRWDRS